jgi:uncharacterized membrane protein SirB2
MEITRLHIYQLLHILSLLVLTAHTFMAFANPAPENRKRTMMITGIAALIMFISGFGLLTINKIPYGSTPWLWVKTICWLALSAMAGIAYRKVHLRQTLAFITLLILGVAVFMVYLRPTF